MTVCVITYHDTGPGQANYYTLVYPDGTTMKCTSVRDMNYKTGVRAPDVRRACRQAREEGLGYLKLND